MIDWEDTDETLIESENSNLVVGCIVRSGNDCNKDTPETKCLVVNLFRRCNEKLFKDLHLRQIIDLRIRDIPEILQTTHCINIPTKAIASLAFVFSLDELEDNEAIGCQGMDSLYLLRFTEKGEPVNPEWCLPYPSRYVPYRQQLPDCYPSRIWNSLKVIRMEISRLLGRYSEKQGLYNTARAKVTINNETWEYLLSKVNSTTGMPRKAITSSVKRLLLPGLTLKSVRVLSNSAMIRFETNGDLHAFSKVFGQQVFIEVRKRRPPINQPSLLNVNDAINVVVGSKERAIPFKEIGFKDDGIDLIFDGRSDLKICFRYRKYLYAVSPTTGGNPRNCPKPLKCIIKRMRVCDRAGSELDATSSENGDSSDADDSRDIDTGRILEAAPSVTISSEFELNGKVYRVSRVNQNQVVAVCIYPMNASRRELTLSLSEAERLVANRLK